MALEDPCPGCGGSFPCVEGPTHRYMESSPGCWACYGRVLAREYSRPETAGLHRLTVDAYALQHPGRPSRQSVRSVALHGISLWAVLEEGLSSRQAGALLRTAAAGETEFRWLDPPAERGSLTVAHVEPARDAGDHLARVRDWTQAVWSAWRGHHPVFRGWFSGTKGS